MASRQIAHRRRPSSSSNQPLRLVKANRGTNAEHYYRAYGLNSISLRYFNAPGCDPDGELGEKHQPETRAIPCAIIAGLRETRFKVNGNDYATLDGTAVRDYVHVSDLAGAHVVAAEMLLRKGGSHKFNLGTETGTSVLQIVAAVERALGTP